MAEETIRANLKWTYIRRNKDGTRSSYGPGEVDIPISFARTLGIEVPAAEPVKADKPAATPKKKTKASKGD